MAEAQVVGICLSTSSRSWLAGLTGPCDWKEVTTSLFLEAATRVTLDAPFLLKKKKNFKIFLFVCLFSLCQLGDFQSHPYLPVLWIPSRLCRRHGIVFREEHGPDNQIDLGSHACSAAC